MNMFLNLDEDLKSIAPSAEVLEAEWPGPDRQKQLAHIIILPPTEETPAASRSVPLKLEEASHRWGRKKVTATVLAAASAAIVAAAAGGISAAMQHPDAAPPGPSIYADPNKISVPDISTVSAVTLLNSAAQHSSQQTDKEVRTNQFIYIKSLQAHLMLDPNSAQATSPQTLSPLSPREIWIPQNPQNKGLIRDNNMLLGTNLPPGTDIPLTTSPDLDPIRQAGQSCAALQALPTDPDALLVLMRNEVVPLDNFSTEDAKTYTENYQLFRMMTDLLDMGPALPAGVQAAIYQISTRLSGASLIQDSIDAAGRHGTAVAMTFGAVREEWIFTKETPTYLGHRSYTIKDTPSGQAGTLVETTAIQSAGISDTAGTQPKELL